MIDKIPLHLKCVGEIPGSPEIGILTLLDEGESMQLTIVCDLMIRQQMELRLMKDKVCNTMVPEVLSNILLNQYGADLEIIINDVIDGTYRAYIFNKENFQPISLRATDAILFHLASGVPLYCTKQLMQRQGFAYKSNELKVAMPFNSLSDKMLKDALANAIKYEKYEVASELRDELNRRKKNERS